MHVLDMNYEVDGLYKDEMVLGNEIWKITNNTPAHSLEYVHAPWF
jgi:hypothetical protein